ncbi:unnamed protein product [Mytilus coruscus]|uniref:Uncharacterized protein n=1 Tax=Mytilus coruscus TaxID=42192 RepID=A0A6J8BWW4_MYTCO|nr:unnamed protein product [Mytilus coruscus]
MTTHQKNKQLHKPKLPTPPSNIKDRNQDDDNTETTENTLRDPTPPPSQPSNAYESKQGKVVSSDEESTLKSRVHVSSERPRTLWKSSSQRISSSAKSKSHKTSSARSRSPIETYGNVLSGKVKEKKIKIKSVLVRSDYKHQTRNTSALVFVVSVLRGHDD